MKKLFVLMTTGFDSCATTAPVDTSVAIDAGDWFIATDSDNTLICLDEYSDDRKVEIHKALFPEEIYGKRPVYVGFEFHKVGRLAEKYSTYLFVKKDETYLVAVNNLGDGRELRLFYHLKDIVE